VPLAAPPDQARYHGQDERPPARYQRHRSFREELSQPDRAYSYTRDDSGTHLRAAQLDETGRLSALVVDVDRGPNGPRTTMALVRTQSAPALTQGPLLQPGRLVNLLV
jgi:hypothetical protein